MIELADATIARGEFVLQDISLKIETGQLALLRGPNGGGKTTIMQTICGLHRLQAGKLLLRGRPAEHLSLAQRRIGWVPQDSVLFEHMTVAQQIAMPLTIRRWSTDQVTARVQELLTTLRIEKLADRLPVGLSGGESRRVALARAVSFEPDILCLDESLVSLDDSTRKIVTDNLKLLQSTTRTTILMISHETRELIQLANQILNLDNGRLSVEFP